MPEVRFERTTLDPLLDGKRSTATATDRRQRQKGEKSGFRALAAVDMLQTDSTSRTKVSPILSMQKNAKNKNKNHVTEAEDHSKQCTPPDHPAPRERRQPQITRLCKQ